MPRVEDLYVDQIGNTFEFTWEYNNRPPPPPSQFKLLYKKKEKKGDGYMEKIILNVDDLFNQTYNPDFGKGIIPIGSYTWNPSDTEIANTENLIFKIVDLSGETTHQFLYPKIKINPNHKNATGERFIEAAKGNFNRFAFNNFNKKKTSIALKDYIYYLINQDRTPTETTITLNNLSEFKEVKLGSSEMMIRANPSSIHVVNIDITDIETKQSILKQYDVPISSDSKVVELLDTDDSKISQNNVVPSLNSQGI